MIPASVSDLDRVVAEMEARADEVQELLGSVPREAALWRPDPTRWSMTGHVAHLCLVNEAYEGTIGRAVEAARQRGGPRSDGPYRHPWIARRFVRMLAPPPANRVKTLRSMVPEVELDPTETARRYRELQARIARHVTDARGFDLGRIRFGSPFLKLLRLSLGTACGALLAHDARHVWLMRELMDRPDFPAAGGGSAS